MMDSDASHSSEVELPMYRTVVVLIRLQLNLEILIFPLSRHGFAVPFPTPCVRTSLHH
jgi:hypothetical protein